jgi:hypothetical protein
VYVWVRGFISDWKKFNVLRYLFFLPLSNACSSIDDTTYPYRNKSWRGQCTRWIDKQWACGSHAGHLVHWVFCTSQSIEISTRLDYCNLQMKVLFYKCRESVCMHACTLEEKSPKATNLPDKLKANEKEKTWRKQQSILWKRIKKRFSTVPGALEILDFAGTLFLKVSWMKTVFFIVTKFCSNIWRVIFILTQGIMQLQQWMITLVELTVCHQLKLILYFHVIM